MSVSLHECFWHINLQSFSFNHGGLLFLTSLPFASMLFFLLIDLIAHHWRNATQNYSAVSPHTNQNGHHKKEKSVDSKCWRGCGHCWCEGKLVQPL